MNIRKPLQSEVQLKNPKLLNVAFNQDNSCFAVCSETGFKVFASYPMELKMERDFSITPDKKNVIDNERPVETKFPVKSINGNEFTGIGIIKMLYKTNYIALVGGGKKPKFPINKVYIWDDFKQKESIVLEFNTPVLNVHLSRKHIFIILKNFSLVYSFKSKPELLYSFETINNDFGVSEIVVYENSSIFVFPGRVVGQLHVVDINNTNTVMANKNNIDNGDDGDDNNKDNDDSDKSKNDFTIVTNERDKEKKSIGLIKAHKNPIQSVCLSSNGKMVASASNQGTIIRIHDTKTCSLLYEFRRGVDSAIVTSMKFSPNNEKLAVLSDKHTLHVYYIQPPDAENGGGGNDDDDNGNGNPNTKHILKNIPLFTKYFRSTWSYVSKDVGHKTDNFHDIGELGWSDDNSIIIIWKFKGIWEKYDIILNTLQLDNSKDSNKWKIVKEGWRSV